MLRIHGQIVKTPESDRTELLNLAALRERRNALRRLIASIKKQRQIERKRNAPITRKRRRPIKHLVATQSGGGEWVREPLPRNDYADFDPKVPTVSKLLSKPIGYRLSKGFNIIRHGNLDR
jgi:hypothetical protein